MSSGDDEDFVGIASSDRKETSVEDLMNTDAIEDFFKPKPVPGFRGTAQRFLDSFFFLGVVTLFVIGDVSIVCISEFEPDVYMANQSLLETVSQIISFAFLTESIARLLAMGPKEYFGDALLVVDGLVSVVSIIVEYAVPPDSGAGAIVVLRFLRIARIGLRVFRQAKRFQNYKNPNNQKIATPLEHCIISLKNLVNIGLIEHPVAVSEINRITKLLGTGNVYEVKKFSFGDDVVESYVEDFLTDTYMQTKVIAMAKPTSRDVKNKKGAKAATALKKFVKKRSSKKVKDGFLTEWNMNVFSEFDDPESDMPPSMQALMKVSEEVFTQAFKLLDLPQSKVSAFVFAVCEGNHTGNPFTNGFRLAENLQSCFYVLFGKPQIALHYQLTETEILAVLLASVCRHFNSPGVSNAFLVNTLSPVAELYNDESVLENYAVASCFKLLRSDSYNMLENLTPGQYREVRDLIVHCIKRSDPLEHLKQVSFLSTRLSGSDEKNKVFFAVKAADRAQLCALVVSFVGFSYACRPSAQYEQWLQAWAAERSREGELERFVNLPVSPANQLKGNSVVEFQSALLKYVISPFIEIFATGICHEKDSVICKGLQANLDFLETYVFEPKEIEATLSVASLYKKIMLMGRDDEPTFQWATLHLRVAEATGINKNDHSNTNPSIRAELLFTADLDNPPAGAAIERVQNQHSHTQTLKKTCSPIFNELMSFVVPMPSQGCKLCLHIRNESLGSKTDLGKVVIPLSEEFEVDQETNSLVNNFKSGWYNIESSDGGSNGKVYLAMAIVDGLRGHLEQVQKKRQFKLSMNEVHEQEREELCSEQYTGYSEDLRAVLESELDFSVCIGTWNVGEAPPPHKTVFPTWLKPGSHVYIVGTQENTNDNWSSNLVDVLNEPVYLNGFDVHDSFVLFKSNQISYHKGKSKIILQLDVVGLKSVFQYTSNIRAMTEATGAGGVIANKGGVLISMNIKDVSMCFVTCHLAAHQNKQEARNDNVREIISGTQSVVSKEGIKIDLDWAYDYVFWCGDLNYRVNFQGKEVGKTPSESELADFKQLCEAKQWPEIWEHDQLLMERKKGNVFHGWREGPIGFPPTFKVKVGDSSFNYHPLRLPAYCDRVLWKSGVNPIIQEGYGTTGDMNTSDHKPVYSTFRFPVYNCPPCTVVNKSAASLVVSQVNVQLESKTPIKEGWVTFFAEFLDDPVKSPKQVPINGEDGTFFWSWDKQVLNPKWLTINNPARLEVCRIFCVVQVPGRVQTKTAAMACLPLKNAFEPLEIKKHPLTLSGLVVGYIDCSLQVLWQSGHTKGGEGLGDLVISVQKAMNVPKMDMVGESDPFISVHIHNKSFKTRHKNDDKNPVWDENFTVAACKDTTLLDQVDIKLFDKDKLTSEEIGTVSTTVHNLLTQTEPYTVVLTKKGAKAAKNGEPECTVWVTAKVLGASPAGWPSTSE
mmetsp:Transcript_25871/g.50981  ORF Transcript_25871/g.50981 Transcript_25871/m.50981 type:complete len:1443 (-) Transcript_25871:116-4444(-)|eukprot:CAMPEP_0175129698 /NCGR_PEP_ID=MMETSP0087-20121206/5612_1 /TAXON_ID=136419 /ORGANISM="Unknown Unknown, Strain D1" /LENGTH=1442 /DNA_ID=CAMNT_0016411867 /DNA_START=30 /DNA_END=4358 /DNA_ORIENTATION=-